MDWGLLTSVTGMAALGGFVGAARAAWQDKAKAWPVKVFDMVVGVLLAASVADYFVPPGSPKMAIFVGLVAGSFGGYLLDAIQALSPNLASGLIEGILGRLGYTRSQPNKED